MLRVSTENKIQLMKMMRIRALVLVERKKKMKEIKISISHNLLENLYKVLFNTKVILKVKSQRKNLFKRNHHLRKLLLFQKIQTMLLGFQQPILQMINIWTTKTKCLTTVLQIKIILLTKELSLDQIKPNLDKALSKTQMKSVLHNTDKVI